MKKIMNKRGDVPTVLLFVVALVLVVAALFTFASSANGMGSQSKESSEIMAELQFNEQFVIRLSEMTANDVINKDLTTSGVNIKEEFRKEILANSNYPDGASYFFGKINNQEFDFVKENGKYTLTINSVYVEGKRGESLAQRWFNLAVSGLIITNNNKNQVIVTSTTSSTDVNSNASIVIFLLGDKNNLSVNSQNYNFNLNKLDNDKITVIYAGKETDILVGNNAEFDLNQDGYSDVNLELLKINKDSNSAVLRVKKVFSPVSAQ